MESKYIITGVKLEEYEALRKVTKSIADDSIIGLNKLGISKPKGLGVDLKYDPKKYEVGIFIGKGREKQPVLDSEGLSKDEELFVDILRDNLEKRLEIIRISEEK